MCIVLYSLCNVCDILQYYFGDFNLLKDTFLQREIRMNVDGCIFFITLCKDLIIEFLCVPLTFVVLK